MTVHLLETKLFVPRRRSGFVPREGLIARLNRGAESRLTLISAPAGFGKTTLLAEWLNADRAGSMQTAWLSLDESDNHPATFWTYLIGAIQTVCPGVGASTRDLLQADPAAIEGSLAGLLNEISSSSCEFVLVLDDYHVIEARPIHDGIAFMLDHMPPTMHLFITSRADPPLPFARLRARGQMTEIRAADLRFTADEAAAFLNNTMGLSLSAQDVASLEARTEGWIAGLQLAALSLQGRTDIAGFIAEFAGDDRYIVDYLVEEVLERQPPAVRQFLLQTSILDRLSGPLCDALTESEGGRATLEALERGNLFVVPLDDKRQWYRYHHLFADVLRAHLLEEQPDSAPALHARASRWFERNDQSAHAIRHALAAGDFARAAALIEIVFPEMLRHRQDVTLGTWLQALPDELIRLRPVLSTGYVGVLLHRGAIETVEGHLIDAEQGLDTAIHVDRGLDAPSGTAVYVDEEQFRDLPRMIALYRAGYSQLIGNLSDTTKYARLALELMPEDHPLRGGAMALLGLALWSSGDLEGAYSTYADGIARVHKAGYVIDSSTQMLADIRIAQGRLRDSLSMYERALQLASAQGAPPPQGTGDLHVGISEMYRERGDLAAATEHLLKSRDLGEGAALIENRYRWFVAMAAVKQAEGDLDRAIELLSEAERVYAGSFAPDVRPISALRTRLWLAQGRLSDALGWVRQEGLSADDDLSYLREFAHITLARVLIAESANGAGAQPLREAETLLARLLDAAEQGGRTGAVIEILVLMAIVQRAHGDVTAALIRLNRAMALAEPEGFIRVFVDEGEPIRDLLSHASRAGIDSAFSRRLLLAFGESTTDNPTPSAAVSNGLTEALTAREVEILRLMGTGLRNQEIADHLVISTATVKRHLANAYGKLGATHRTEALRRANELRLL